MSLIYRNKLIINQRGGSLEIDNSTEDEKLKISQRSGSNINLTNIVTSELATNNKQLNVVNDSYETIGGDKNTLCGKDKITRTGENSYELDGFINQSQLDSFTEWKDLYQTIAKLNSQFKIKRGGNSFPNGEETKIDGKRSENPVLKNAPITVENKFNGYNGIPVRNNGKDEVVSYVKVIDRGNTKPASSKKITINDIQKSAGSTGSKAPGVVEFGASLHAATENGEWEKNTESSKLPDDILELQKKLTAVESNMGNGGDKISCIKRNKFEQVGAIFNDFPSIRIDPKGRSQPFEMLVSDTGTYKNHDYVPHVEEVDNSSNFPCGNDDKIIGNRYSRNVGSGGINFKTTGPVEISGTSLKTGFKRINLNASHGIQIGSESFVEIQSLKSITLRTNRQVYIDSSLGVRGNVVVGGGISVEGELYVQHITAPLEVHQTEDTILFGKFASNNDRALLIGETLMGGEWYPTYAKSTHDLIVNYPHSHHHNGIPMRLTEANKDVRSLAQKENINNHSNVSQAIAQIHERKVAVATN
jgi:hypothetical protein